MTKKSIIAIASIAAALAGCSGAERRSATEPLGDRTAGTVDFNLTLPNGESADTIDLHLECPGIDQDHEIDVENGVAKAAFGGLEGTCTVTLATVTDDGTDCEGSEMFTVLDGQVIPVSVTLTCQGYSEDGNGGVVISPDFETRDCTTDRILKVYAVPSTLLLGASTDVQVEIHPGSLVGTATYSYEVLNDATHPGEGTLSAASGACATGAASCQEITCDGIGGSSAVDALTGLPVGGLYVAVTVEDDTCRDTETVLVECLQASVCGDGTVDGVEECDDSNTTSGDGCSAGCDDEVCGDGVINNSGAEECDGTAGVGPNQACDVVTCQLIDLPFCGDNDINQPSEVCDGSDTPAGRTCSATCTFVPVCGNGFVEGTEVCDDGNVVGGDTCSADCSTGTVAPFCGDNTINQASEVCDGTAFPAGTAEGSTCNATCTTITAPAINLCYQCVSTGPIAEGLTNSLCSTSSDPLCNAVLQCYIGPVPGNTGCFATGATPAECYCGAGADTDACATPAFVPAGPCATAMRAAKPGASNAEILDGVFGFDTLGWAGQIMLEAQGLCPSDCGF